MEDIKISLFRDEDKEKWDNFVLSHPRGTYYHLSAWKWNLEESFGLKPFYLIASDTRGEIVGILPLFLMRDVFMRKFFISLPFSNYGSLCVSHPEARSALLVACEKLAGKHKVRYVEFRNFRDKIDNLPLNGSNVTFLLDLTGGVEDLWNNSLQSNKRNKVRKAEKSGLSPLIGREYLKDFYKIFAANMRRLGTPPFPFAFFENIIKIFNENAEVIIIKKGETIVAGMFLILFKGILSVPWASSMADYNVLCPNELMYWTALRYGCRRGFKIFDMGRSPKNSGTYNFKKQWGAEPEKLDYQYILIKDKELPSIQKKYSLAVTAWKKMPLSWSVLIGSKLVKYLPEL